MMPAPATDHHRRQHRRDHRHAHDPRVGHHRDQPRVRAVGLRHQHHRARRTRRRSPHRDGPRQHLPPAQQIPEHATGRERDEIDHQEHRPVIRHRRDDPRGDRPRNQRPDRRLRPAKRRRRHAQRPPPHRQHDRGDHRPEQQPRRQPDDLQQPRDHRRQRDQYGPPPDHALVANQIVCRAPPFRVARAITSSTAKPASASRVANGLLGADDHTASTPPGRNAARARDNPRAP